MFSYQNRNGMNFSIDQLDEQIRAFDKQLENSWKDLKDVCENLSGKKFDGTLEAVDDFFSSNVLENSVCSTAIGDSVGNLCSELINFIQKNPGSESLVFDNLLQVMFKEGLNFPICSRDACANERNSTKASLFESEPHFNELFAKLQQHFLGDALKIHKPEQIKEEFGSSGRSGRRTSGNLSGHFSSFAREMSVERRQYCFQNLCLISSPDHSLVLLANSKSVLVRNKFAGCKLIATEFVRAGQDVVEMLKEDASFLRLCVEEEDLKSFISTVYLDPLLEALGSLVDKLVEGDGSSNAGNRSELPKKTSLLDAKAANRLDDVALRGGTVSDLLHVIGWFIQAEDLLMGVHESSLRCLVGQERSRTQIKNDQVTELKSALKNSGTGKKKQGTRPALPSVVFNWRTTLEKFSPTLLQCFDVDLNDVCSDNDGDAIVSVAVPHHLRQEFFRCPVAHQSSILFAEVVHKYGCLFKFFGTFDKDSRSKMLTRLSESVSKHVDSITKKINKEATIESMVVLLSGMDFLECYLNRCKEIFQTSAPTNVRLLRSAKTELSDLIRFKFIDIIIISVWPEHEDSDADDKNEATDFLQNWWLQMDWLWTELANHCSFEVSSRIFSRCLSSTLQKFAWHYASRRVNRTEIGQYVTDIKSILSGSLELIFRFSGKFEEVAGGCFDDGALHEVHASCVAMTTAMIVAASPLSVMKEMYEGMSGKTAHSIQLDEIVGSDCQWLWVVRPDWNLPAKMRMNHLDARTFYEIVFSLLEHHPFEKQYILLQLMCLQGSHFPITLLRHLVAHEKNLHKDDKDHGGDDDDGVGEVINALLMLIMKCQSDEDEQMFDLILLEVAKKFQKSELLRKGSATFNFLCEMMVPAMLKIVWKSVKEAERSSHLGSPLLSGMTYFTGERLFCGCKPSSGGERSASKSEGGDAGCLKVFASELLRQFHCLDFTVSRFCFKYDAQFGRDKKICRPIIFEVLHAVLQRIECEVLKMDLFSDVQKGVLKAIVDMFPQLTSSSSSSSLQEQGWVKEFLSKIDVLGREILKVGVDDNDPGHGVSKSCCSSALFQVLLTSIASDKSDKESINTLTIFLINNLDNMRDVFIAPSYLPSTTGTAEQTLSFNFSCLLQNAGTADASSVKSDKDFNPLRALQKFKLGQSSLPIDWNLCKKMDLGLTEVNFPNLLKNRPEFRGDSHSADVDEIHKAFLDLLKEKHLRDPP